ncbi:Cas10/Cmr2 second palm domain-containing protein [Pseudoalteromonas sp. R3]|uniref:Cas10/Cmr2 second palm domain-containing protein n=1 Tax=Pseudoalteromonas sp. R3 TaxID=1709477 RepID=UPI0006B41C60|nr:hypothetical protein [Pseudoalteromonas sp. R3]
MTYCYLFEARSIQHYLFRTGKLRDVVAASERLDRLIDSSEHSVLYQVLQATQLRHDLLTEHPDPDPQVRFFRCKGGAFYACSDDKETLQTLRDSWTLTFAQLYPGLEYCDALAQGQSVAHAKQAALYLLAQARNFQPASLPVATTLCARAQRTGSLAVKLRHEELVDLPSWYNEQAYNHWDLRDKDGALQARFKPTGELLDPKLVDKIAFPLDLESEFPLTPRATADDSESELHMDIALLHIDGNGMGQVLQDLDKALSGAGDDVYCSAFRDFSEAMATATQQAAQQATLWLTKRVLSEQAENSELTELLLPMRPLVLGGDDVTLLCRADLALEYTEQFCAAFEQTSRIALKPTYEVIKAANAESTFGGKLTASAGVLIQKAKHPFTHSHEMTEQLCKQAKVLTKQANGTAALAFVQVSNTVSDGLDTFRARHLSCTVGEDVLHTSLGAYLLSEYGSYPTLKALNALFDLLAQACTPMTLSKWREVLTYLGMGDLAEVQRVIYRDFALNGNKAQQQKLAQAFAQLSARDKEPQESWHWQGENGWVTPLSDLMVLEKLNRLSVKSIQAKQQPEVS